MVNIGTWAKHLWPKKCIFSRREKILEWEEMEVWNRDDNWVSKKGEDILKADYLSAFSVIS